MKMKKQLWMRWTSWVLALAILLGSVNLGQLLWAYAEDSSSQTKTYSQIVAENYELSEAEEALLTSGCLASEKVAFEVISGSNLITVDTERKTIKAETKDNWVPVQAEIRLGDAALEAVTLTDGVGSYAYAGNAFSVAVTYELRIGMEEQVQTDLLSTPGWLKDGLVKTNAVSAQGGNLFILEKAMPELVSFANSGVQTSFGTVSFSDDCAAAVKALNGQMAANGGKLDLSVSVAEYDAGSKTQYLLTKGMTMQAQVVDTHEKLGIINTALTTMYDNLGLFIQSGWISQTLANQIKTLAGVCGNLVNGLDSVAKHQWIAAEKGTALVVNGVDYAKLDELVKGLGGITSVPEIRNPLVAAKAVSTKNLAMSDVTVKLVLHTVNENNEVVLYHETAPVVLTLSKKATAGEIQAAIDAAQIVEHAIADWGAAYAEGKFDVTANRALPQELTGDLEYILTYTPKTYTVTYGYETDAPTSVPYGYHLTLPVHSNSAMAYDYTIGEAKYAQGSVYTVLGDTEITRREGKAYTVTDLYTIVADNYGNDMAKAILTSGALLGNTAIRLRVPDPTNVEALLQLMSGTLTAQNYSADYSGLSWVPATYGVAGTEYSFSGNTAAWNGSSAKVQYRLTLTNFSAGQVQDILNLAAQLKAEADAQKGTLDRLNSKYSTMEGLDRAKLGALNGVIDVTDFTPGDNTEADAANIQMRAYFKGLVSGIIANNLGSNNKLKIYNMLTEYRKDGLRYYYENSAEVIGELNSLSGYLSGMLADDAKLAALKIMVGAVGYPDYADKIQELERLLTEVKAALTAPNAKIDLHSSHLGKLLDELEKEGSVVCQPAGHPYLFSQMLTALDETQAMVQVIVEKGESRVTITSQVYDLGAIVSETDVAALQAKLDEAVQTLLGDKAAYHNVSITGMPIGDLVGMTLNDTVYITYSYTEKPYTVRIEGEGDQTITISQPEIQLPQHPDYGWVYYYTIGGKSDITSSTYRFTVEELDTLFVNGVYSVSRVAVNEGMEKLESAFTNWIVKDGAGNLAALRAQVAGNRSGVMELVTTLVNSGYTYIAFNDRPILYMRDDTLEISVQAVIDTLIHDDSFSSDKLIALSENGGGEVLQATIALGNTADDKNLVKAPFTLTLTSMPGRMATVAAGLKAIKPYMSFRTNNGVLDVTMDLPEEIYQVYLTALLAAGRVEKDHLEEINSEIALQFLWDYVETVLSTEADTTTLTNTLAMLGVNRDLSGYENYYQMLRKLLLSEGVSINPVGEDGKFDLSVSFNCKALLDGAMDLSAYSAFLGMIKEYKDQGSAITMDINALLADTQVRYEALYLDGKTMSGSAGTGFLARKSTAPASAVAYTTDASVLRQMSGEGMMILLDDVNSNLVFNGTVGILDLNGQTVNGSVTANGTLYIVDSSMDSAQCGAVKGTVSGNAVILGGRYFTKSGSVQDVASFLKDGYVQHADGYVHNALYTVDHEGNDMVFRLDTDVWGGNIASHAAFAGALAVDLTMDLALNCYTAAALSAEDSTLYAIDLSDLVGLLTGGKKSNDLIEKVLQSIYADNMSGFINTVLADLLDFAALEEAAKGDGAVADYQMAIAPWTVDVEHVNTKGNDYLSFGVKADSSRTRNFRMVLQLDGNNKAGFAQLAHNLDQIVQSGAINVLIQRPVYMPEENALSVKGSVSAEFVLNLASRDDRYAIVLSVALADSGCAEKKDLVAAVNAGNMKALKAAFDKVTVNELITALKKLDGSVSIADLASRNGVSAQAISAGEVEKAYDEMLCLAGQVLQALKFNGSAQKMGKLDESDGASDGIYVMSGTFHNDSVQAVGVYGDLTASVSVKFSLFDLCDHSNVKTLPAKPVSCTENGLTEGKQCESCGRILVKQEEIPAPGHTEKILPGAEATCTKDGLTEGKVCTACGEVLLKQEKIPASGHSKEILPGKPATCTEGGVTEGVKCKVCGEILTAQVEIPPQGHAEELIPGKSATCTAAGLTEGKQCKVCGEILQAQQEIPMLDHVEGILEARDATCSTVGLTEGKHCTACGEILLAQQVIPVLEHVERELPARAPTCTVDGLTEGKKCSLCGEILLAQQVIPALGHTEEVIPGKEPTCLETGISADKKCSVCGEVLAVAEEIPALGHAWNDWIAKTKPTCTEPGEEIRLCKRCHEMQKRMTPATGCTVIPGIYESDKDYHWGICEDCGQPGNKEKHHYQVSEDHLYEQCTKCQYKRDVKVPVLGDQGIAIFAVAAVLSGVLLTGLFIWRRKRKKDEDE